MKHPILFQINTRCWLRELSERHGCPITLANLPEDIFTEWRRFGFTHIWLMGVWTTGARARQLALEIPDLRRAYETVLPGWREEDVAGSPYSVSAYQVPGSLGGDRGLAEFRKQLHARGLKLVLDFVPNHMGLDHSWLEEHPEYFVQAGANAPGAFERPTHHGIRWIANGKDPYFPPWTDVAQLEYRYTATRKAMTELLLDIAARCDGVRCDMAMLLLNEVFAKTWGHIPYSGPTARSEFWADTISTVKDTHPGFIFMAEVYWGLEGTLQSLGFDYTYDKQLYDDLIWHNYMGAQKRLLESSARFVERSVHFLENHDEPRAATRLPVDEHGAAALVILGLPGMRFLHDGQLDGAKLHVPVQLGRRPLEPVNTDLRQQYEHLLTTLTRSAVGCGQARLLSPRAAWAGNPTGQNFVLVQWQAEPDRFEIVVVNLAPHRSQCFVPVEVAGLSDHNWSMKDLLGTETYKRVGSDLARHGVYLDLPPHGAQLFHFEPTL